MEQERREREEREQRAAEEAGRKGGAAAMAAPTYAGERAEASLWTRDLVRWGPIWGGLLVGLGIHLVLTSIGLAVALGVYDPASPAFATQVGNTVAIWSAISLLVSLFVGGFIAGRMGAILGLQSGVVQGSVLWGLAIVFTMVLGSIGIAGFLGAIPDVTQLMAGVQIGVEEARMAVGATSTALWWFVVGAILAWAAATGGSVLGTSRHEEEIERGHGP